MPYLELNPPINVDALLAGHEAHLWLVTLENTATYSDNQLLNVLNDAETLHYNSLRVPAVKQEYLATRNLVRHALSHYANVAPNEWAFSKNPNGRPELDAPFKDLNLNFNLSHSHGAIVCLVACGHQVGVDIETTHHIKEFWDMARMVLSPHEITVLHKKCARSGEDPREFLRYWTLKEAYTKALGLGLSVDFTQIVCDFNQEIGVDALSNDGFRALPTETWQFLQGPVLANHMLAVAIRKTGTNDIPVRMMPVKHGLSVSGNITYYPSQIESMLYLLSSNVFVG